MLTLPGTALPFSVKFFTCGIRPFWEHTMPDFLQGLAQHHFLEIHLLL
jgi:hypothetical protein